MKPGSGCCLGGTATPRLVHRHPCGGVRLDKAEEWVLGAGTVSGSVHRRVLSGATAMFFPIAGKGKGGTAMLCLVHRPFLSREGVFQGLA